MSDSDSGSEREASVSAPKRRRIARGDSNETHNIKMPPLSLEGDKLGEKHKHFNKIVHEAVKNKKLNLTKINSDDNDIDNLLKIDMASKSKNVDYIIEVLKCEDLLYVSRAIKHSVWLITKQEYAHIINPEYLNTQLFPHMLTKAINKLLLHIRLHLKDEKRVELFYEYYKDISSEGHKWLLYCSIPFIENVIQNERRIPLQTYKRLCQRSVKFLQYYTRVEGPKDGRILGSVIFLTKSHTDEYLKMLETTENYLLPLSLTKKSTEIIMRKYPQRLLNNFEKYAQRAHLAVVAKYMEKEKIGDFILQHTRTDLIKYHLQQYENLKPFIDNMPENKRFEFIKETSLLKGLASQNADEIGTLFCFTNSYNWYQYAPFDVAFTALKKLIHAEPTPAERCAMMSVLITCAKNNPQYIKMTLHYYYDKHRSEPLKFKIQFMETVITQMSTYELDSETWNILNNLFRNVGVYSKSENKVQICLEAVILYKTLHDENIPDIVEEKITFDTFKKYQCKLNEEQQNKIFSYLINSLSLKLQNKVIDNESHFKDAIDLLKNAFNLLMDWNKNIIEYAFVLDYMQRLLKISKENSWKTELSSLYNKNKSWRRYMFEESLALCPNQEVCLNALKHNPQLLERHRDNVDALRTDDTFSLLRFLAKLRTYWPHTFGQQFTDANLNSINNTPGHEAIIKGLCMLLPQKPLIDLAKKYAPKDTVIDWSEVDQTELRVSKTIASNLYLARPLISLDAVLWYAKGDYLQYSIPSLSSVLHNISKIQSRGHISKLLDAPVSLQKHGLNFAFMKLNCDELKPIFSGIWKSTNNPTIQTHLFAHTYNMLCKAKDPAVVKQMWEMLSMFFDNLPLEENEVILSKLSKVKPLHISVQGEFCMKGYTFLKSLPIKGKCDIHIEKIVSYAPNIMELLDADFVADKILAPIKTDFPKSIGALVEVMSSYVLHGKTEEDQCARFRRSLAPALDQAFTLKVSVGTILNTLITDFVKYTCAKKIIIPVKLFTEIKSWMEHNINIDDNYVQYTRWKLVTDYVKLVDEHKTMLNDPKLDKLAILQFRFGMMPPDAEKIWEAIQIAISAKMGTIVLKYLKEDNEKYLFPTLYWLFSKALISMYECITFGNFAMKMEMLPYILEEDFIPSYLVVGEFQSDFEQHTHHTIGAEKRLEIRKLLLAHPSKEVQMHCKIAFGRKPN